MGRSRRRSLLVPLLALTAASCAEAPAFVETTALDATMRVWSYEDGSGAMSLRVATLDGTPTRLENTDEVNVAVAGWSIDVARPSDGPDPVYSAALPEAPPDDAINVAVLRQETESAPFNGAVFPAAFGELTLPDSWSRSADQLEVTWTEAGDADPITLRIDGSCIDPYEVEVDSQAAAFTVPPGAIASPSGVPNSGCPITLQLTRARPGEPDPAWNSGQIEALTRAERLLTVHP